MKKIILATGNKNKVREIKEMLPEYEIISMRDAGFSGDITENGNSFEENALIKARTVWKKTGGTVMADDSGLVVDYLDGEPGIYSARYLGEDTSYTVKMQSIIDRLKDAEGDERKARFACAIACIFPDESEKTLIGYQEGIIGKEIKGKNGFGYDACFYGNDCNGLSNAEIDEETKNRVSHRGKAVRMMKQLLGKTIMAVSLTIIISAAACFTSFASMNLEAGAPVSGIAVAMNNYFAKTMEPEKNIAESIRMVKHSIVIGEDEVQPADVKTAAQMLAEEVETKEETIVTENGATYGTVKNTSNLRLREEPNMDSRTITLLSEGETYIVIGQDGDFLKIQVDDDMVGYVFKDYVTLSIKTEAEIQAEREARAKENERLKKEAEEALRKLEEEREKERLAEESRAEESRAEESRKAEESKAEESRKAEESKKAEESRMAETIESINMTSGENPEESEDETVESRQAAETERQTEKPTETQTETKASETSGPGGGNTPSAAVVSAGPGGTGTGSSRGKLVGPGSGSSTAERNAIVAYAKQFLGGRYVYGGTDLEGGSGVDCSGFTMRIYEKFGHSIGRTSRDQAGTGRSIDPSEARPGDLFFYSSGGTINHVTMYIGDGNVIHASNSTTGIIISSAYYRTPCKVCTYLD